MLIISLKCTQPLISKHNHFKILLHLPILANYVLITQLSLSSTFNKCIINTNRFCEINTSVRRFDKTF